MRNSNKKDENKKFKNKIVKIFFSIYCILYLDYVMNNVCGTFSSMYIYIYEKSMREKEKF